jgi:hypothetical protein
MAVARLDKFQRSNVVSKSPHLTRDLVLILASSKSDGFSDTCANENDCCGVLPLGVCGHLSISLARLVQQTRPGIFISRRGRYLFRD